MRQAGLQPLRLTKAGDKQCTARALCILIPYWPTLWLHRLKQLTGAKEEMYKYTDSYTRLVVVLVFVVVVKARGHDKNTGKPSIT